MSLTTSEMTPADIRACTCGNDGYGNGMFGGLVYQPEETVMEVAFTRNNHWRNNLKKWDRLTLSQMRKIDKEEAPGTLALFATSIIFATTL